MEIYLLRHAIAVESEKFRGEDSRRPLTREGAKKMRRAAKGIRSLGLSFDLILTSPYLRARETADIVAHVCKLRRVECSDFLTPGGDQRKLLGQLRELRSKKSVMLVGHEPHLGRLLATLIGARLAAALQLKKGGVCLLSAERLRYGACAKLEWLLTPRQLVLAGR
jgi:phosphohistidine phosphatase